MVGFARRKKRETEADSQGFGKAILQRRQELGLTQEEIARRVNVSTPYVGLLELGRRHPSEEVVIKLAQVLELDTAELFLLANPGAKMLISQEPEPEGNSAWESFSRDRNLRKIHDITEEEMEMLSRVARMGQVRSVRDFIFILNSIRQALWP